MEVVGAATSTGVSRQALGITLGPGVYGPSSCSVNATVAVSITGSGSASTTIDCSGAGRVLLANDSVALTGLNLRGGLLAAAEPLPPNGTVYQGMWGAGTVRWCV